MQLLRMTKHHGQRLMTGRDVSVRLVRNAPPYTSYPYRADSQAAYEGWSALVSDYRDTNKLSINRTTKFMLLTNDWMNSETLGVVGVGQQFALATLTNKQVVGHELGHLLDAEHELADVRYNGWRCATFMAAKVNSLLSNCYVYTDPQSRTHQGLPVSGPIKSTPSKLLRR